jgi:hypothetical protein
MAISTTISQIVINSSINSVLTLQVISWHLKQRMGLQISKGDIQYAASAGGRLIWFQSICAAIAANLFKVKMTDRNQLKHKVLT